MSNYERKLDEINNKLDVLISLLKIGVKKELTEISTKLREDPVSIKLLELADGSIKYRELKDKVAEITGVHEVTVRRRISELAEMGLIFGKREGRDVYYINSGIIE